MGFPLTPQQTLFYNRIPTTPISAPLGDLLNQLWSLIGAGAVFQQDQFTVLPAQTTFALSYVPQPNSLLLSVNGVLYLPGVDYTLSTAVVTWVSSQFALQAGDVVFAHYAY